jgi:type I restriction enzyme S subunit
MRHKFEDIAINSISKQKPVDEDIQTYIGLEHLDTGELLISRYGSKVPIKGEKLIMAKGDVLFGRRNTYLRRAAIAPHDGLFSAHGMVLRPKEDVIDKDFFPFFIGSDYFFDAAIRISVGSLSPTVNWGQLKHLEFDLPTILEQQRLATLLWSANNVRNSYRDLLTLTDELVKSRFVEMFGDPDSNVHGWELLTIRDIVTDVRYGTSKPSVEDGEYVYLRMNNITYDGQLDLSDTKRINVPDSELNKCIVQCGDVLFNRTNSRELVGKTCVFNLSTPMVIAGYIIRVRLDNRVLPEYLSTTLNLERYKDLLRQMCKGAIGQANINAQELQDIQILVPPIELQNEFLALLKAADKSKFELQRTIEEMDATYKSILRDAFSIETSE